MTKALTCIIPNWPAPDNIVAFSTTRQGGVSEIPFASLNLGNSAGDTPEAVQENRRRLQEQLALPQAPNWLSQIHSNVSLKITADYQLSEADASLTRLPNTVCAIMTADCLPILICNEQGDEVAAIHAGWRSLAGGVIENTIEQLRSSSETLLAWLGPAIGPAVYEVGSEVRQAFVDLKPEATDAFVASTNDNKWLADLNMLAKQRLQRLGIQHIYGGDYCTYSNPERFFSYRRDGQTGRQTSLIYYR
jgi:YfiH family protein